MPLKTARGVYLDLKDSTYIYKYDNLVFYFSSQFYLNKFIDNVKNYVEMQKRIFENSYKCKINDSTLFAIKFYKLVEKRGFRIEKIENNECKILHEYIMKLKF